MIKGQINKKVSMKKKEESYYNNKKIRYINYKELHRSYVELQNRLKALEEKCTMNDSENN